MKIKKILVVLITALVMTTAVGCNNGKMKKETESIVTEVQTTIDVSTIIMDNKYLDWKETDYNKANLNDRMNAYITYIYEMGTWFGASDTEAQFVEKMAATYTTEIGDMIMKELYAIVEGGTIQDAIDMAMALEAIPEKSDTTD
jgi:hypothetical protein